MTLKKICTKCGTSKPVGEFNIDNSRSDGLTCWCRECSRARSLERYESNVEKSRAKARLYYHEKGKVKQKLYYEENRETIKAYKDAMYKANREVFRKRSRDWHHRNKESVAEKRRAYYLKNRELFLKNRKEYYENNKEVVVASNAVRRARLADAIVKDAEVTATMISARWEMWGGRCYVCGREAQATDHVKPIAKGGKHIASNLRPICKSCNSRKSAKWKGAANVLEK